MVKYCREFIINIEYITKNPILYFKIKSILKTAKGERLL